VRQPGPRSDDSGGSAGSAVLTHCSRPNRGPYRPDLRRLPQKPRLALDLWELLELCDSPGRGRTIAVDQLAHLLTDTLHRPNRGPYRCGLRRLPLEPRLALDLWELLELCDSREALGQ
jgi:hypothetical protein